MTDDSPESADGKFFAAGTSFGGRTGDVPELSGTSWKISGTVDDPQAFWATAVARHHEALDAYVAALSAAALDVTDDRLIEASSKLHSSLTTLGVAHTALAGWGFPSPRHTPANAETNLRPPKPASMPRVSPPLHAAVTGDVSQRLSVANMEPIPLEAQLVLAKDPDENLRAWLLGTTQLDRATILLMERDETAPQLRELIGEHPYSSIEAKLSTPVMNLRYDVVEMACEQLGLPESAVLKIWRARLKIEKSWQADESMPETTLGEVVAELGLTA